jgi:hypothetical protein
MRAGDAIEDYCRACKIDRQHTIVACDGSGQPVRVTCSYCRSEHNYRGGPRMDAGTAVGPRPATPRFVSSDAALERSDSAPRTAASPPRETRSQPGATSMRGVTFDLVTDRERIMPAMSVESSTADLELLLRRIIREETGLTPVTPADRWRGGHLVLRPGTEGLQERTWPIETFFHKIVMLRNRLRTLEQQLNASDLPEDAKVKLQSYITGCYGSLTSFNVLFANEDDQFKGTGE